MKYLLILMSVFYALTAWSYHWAKGQGDNFGAGFVPIVAGLVSVILTVAYVIAALWSHRLW